MAPASVISSPVRRRLPIAVTDRSNEARLSSRLPAPISLHGLQRHLSQPIFTFKELSCVIPSLTYRQVNHWDSCNLLDAERVATESGWRRFSFFQAITLQLISDLRVVGIDTETAARIRHNLHYYEGTNRPSRWFERAVVDVLNGNKLILRITANGGLNFWTESDFVTLPSWRHFEAHESPYVVLPFHIYVERLLSNKHVLYKVETTAKSFYDTLPTNQERRILQLIRSSDYKEITIKKNDATYHVKLTTQQHGSFTEQQIVEAVRRRAYQSVKVSTKDGKHVVLTQEESVKV